MSTASVDPSGPAGPHPADAHDVIRVVGARTHNLRDVSVEIPKRRLTVVTGVSGSGKSSLVFGTVAAEAQRLVNETYSAFVQGFLPALPRPDVDVLEGLTTAIVVGQERMGAGPRSTVGTATDATTLLRILFSRIGTPHIGGPQAFSFNVATVSGAGAVTVQKGGRQVKERRAFSVTGGMCPRCEGTGQVSDIDLTALYDDTLSLADGALRIPGYSMDGWHGRIFRGAGLFPMDRPIKDFTQRQLEALLHTEPTRIQVDGINLTYQGLIPQMRRSMLSKDLDALQPHVRRFVEQAVTFGECPECHGTRLNELARSVTVAGESIDRVCAMQIDDAAAWLRGLDAGPAAPLVAGLQELLDAFTTIGLGYLSLDRPTGTLSGGESQRTKLVRQLGSALTDVTYVFDEPSAGLHPQDLARVTELLGALRDKGNTVLVVEHTPEVVRLADHVVDLGPGAGAEGGRIVFEGSVAGLAAADTPTGRHLRDRARLKDEVRTPVGHLEIRGADRNSLQDVDVDVPLGVLVAVTGVAGSGKSSLVHGSLAGRAGVVVIDQSPLRGSRRSSPATATGLLEPLRRAFAKANGVKPALFSSNSAGACPACRGAGVVETDLATAGVVETVCPECVGRRFLPEVLELTLAGRSIADVLEMTVDEAAAFVAEGEAHLPTAARILARLQDVGLGYLTVGRPLTTLSGGERQRLTLAAQLGEKAEVIVLDEPTTGLHPSDVGQLLALLDRLVDGGTSVVVVEHHQAVVAHADHVIDLGPGAGHDGGRVVFEGTPAALAAAASTPTGRHLAAHLAGGSVTAGGGSAAG